MTLGMTVGSILLDDDFEKTVLHRLEKANDDMPMGIDCLDLIAADMRASTEFQYVPYWIIVSLLK